MIDPVLAAGAVVIGLCLAGIAFCSLGEAALVSISEVTVRRLTDEGDRRAAVVRELRSTGDYVTSLIVGMNAGIILASTVMTVLVARAWANHRGFHGELAHLGMVAVILVVAELAPKTYGSAMADTVALRVAPAVRLWMGIAAPVTAVLNGISGRVLQAMGVERIPLARLITQDEIRAAADLGEEEGIVEPSEGEMLDSLIDLSEAGVREIMVPRVEMVALPITATVDEVIATAQESGFSRIPVYSGTIDRIVGVLYVTDLLRQLQGGVKPLDLWSIAREPFFVPETKLVWELFREMRERATHIAIVIDEYGGTEGLATIEDILEELVGEIEDEHDIPTEEIVRLDSGDALVRANTRIGDVNDELGLELPEDEYETMGGLVAGLAGRIPAPGERIRAGELELVVEEGDDQRIGSVRVILPGPQRGQ